MASAVGHALGAVVLWEAGRHLPGHWVPDGRRWYLAPAAIGFLPDLDVVVSMIFGPAAHRGPSHSLVIGVALGLAAAGLCRWILARPGFAKLFLVCVACAWVHPLLDYLMACGPPVPFLWPLSERGYLSPVQLIPTAYYSTSASGLLRVIFHPRTWAGIVLEFFILGGAFFAIRCRAPVRKILFAAMSAGGLFLTWLIYD